MFIKYSEVEFIKILEEDNTNNTDKTLEEKCEDSSVEEDGEEQSAENSDD
jgi:hypothetical protein